MPQCNTLNVYIDNNLASRQMLELMTEYCYLANATQHAKAKIVITPTLLAEYSSRRVWFKDHLCPELVNNRIDQCYARHKEVFDFPAPNSEDVPLLQCFVKEIVTQDTAYQRYAHTHHHICPKASQIGRMELSELIQEVKYYSTYLMQHPHYPINTLSLGKDAADRSIIQDIKLTTKDFRNRHLANHLDMLLVSKDSILTQIISSYIQQHPIHSYQAFKAEPEVFRSISTNLEKMKQGEESKGTELSQQLIRRIEGLQKSLARYNAGQTAAMSEVVSPKNGSQALGWQAKTSENRGTEPYKGVG